MYQKLLQIIQTELNAINRLNIDKVKNQKLFRLTEELYESIQYNHESKITPLLKKIINYIGYNKELIFNKELVEINRKLLKFINNSFPLSIEEELIDIASEQYLNDKINIDDYFLMLYPKEEQRFDGKLTKIEIERLTNAGFTKKQIEEIKKFVMEKKEYLTGFHDLVGDILVPKKLFMFNIKHTSHIFTSNPEEALSKTGIKIRSKTTAPLIKALGGNFMTSRQIFEDRNELKGIHKKDEGIILPNEPVILAPNHHFKDDALATVKAAQRPFYFMFGSIPLYFNTLDGILTYLFGAILINRKNSTSKKDSYIKAGKAIDLGSDLYWAFEAVHNRTANLLVLDAWKGIYRLANEKGVKVVPIVHYIKDPTQRIIPNNLNPIHTVVDEPIDLTKYMEKQGLEYLKDVISTWYYLMMEKYGKMDRNELFELYTKRATTYYGVDYKNFEKFPLTSAEIGELYNLDLRGGVDYYDSEIETNAHYQDSSITPPEKAFETISKLRNINNIQDVIYARELIRTRKYENYQKRF